MDQLSKSDSVVLVCSSVVRRRRRRMVALVCLLLLCSCSMRPDPADIASDQSDGTAAVSDCALDLWIPRYGLGGSPGQSVGPISSVSTIGADGRVTSVGFDGGTKRAQDLVQRWLRESRFSPKCAGKKVTVVFTFVTEGPAAECPFSWITFGAPNHFFIHSRALTPHVFRTSNAPKAKADRQ